eukprot:6290557-Prymnesium_polylepis.1
MTDFLRHRCSTRGPRLLVASEWSGDVSAQPTTLCFTCRVIVCGLSETTGGRGLAARSVQRAPKGAARSLCSAQYETAALRSSV